MHCPVKGLSPTEDTLGFMVNLVGLRSNNTIHLFPHLLCHVQPDNHGGNLKLLNKTQQKGNAKYRAVDATDMQSWLGTGSDFRRNFLPPWGQGLVGTKYVTKSPRVGAGNAADRWLQFLSLLCTQVSQKAHHFLHVFCAVFLTRYALMKLQPKSKAGFVGGISSISC